MGEMEGSCQAQEDCHFSAVSSFQITLKVRLEYLPYELCCNRDECTHSQSYFVPWQPYEVISYEWDLLNHSVLFTERETERDWRNSHPPEPRTTEKQIWESALVSQFRGGGDGRSRDLLATSWWVLGQWATLTHKTRGPVTIWRIITEAGSVSIPLL